MGDVERPESGYQPSYEEQDRADEMMSDDERKKTAEREFESIPRPYVERAIRDLFDNARTQKYEAMQIKGAQQREEWLLEAKGVEQVADYLRGLFVGEHSSRWDDLGRWEESDEIKAEYGRIEKEQAERIKSAKARDDNKS